MNTKLSGRGGEARAAEYLRKKGYKIIGMNYTTRFGEIDIIAEDRRNVVFVEVKLRKNADFALAREFVTFSKRERIKKTALIWLVNNGDERPARFDVIEIYYSGGAPDKINHIEDAFQ